MADAGIRRPTRRFLPSDPRVSEPWRLTPQAALRVAALGAVALAAFAILFLRLWALQVLSGEQYLKAAQDNQLRTLRIEAARGPILDRNGRPLVTNVAGFAVQIWPTDLPKGWHERRAELRRLSKVVSVPVSEMLKGIRARKGDPLTPVTVKEGIHPDQVAYLYERRADFHGVQIAQNYLRKYPYQSLAAQILGYPGEISAEQLKQRPRYKLGDTIGQAGVEATYDSYLRGRAGLAELRVDSSGEPRSALTKRVQPRPGNAIRLTLDVDLQRAAESALRYGISLARGAGNYNASGGAIVALDPRDGSVLALASNPTYQPSIFSGRVDPQKLKEVTDPTKARLLNRAISGLYPAGSTFKPVTALAAMQEHIISPYDSLACTPSIKVAGQTFSNWNPNTNQMMTLPEALAASCDTYFYQLGNDFYNLPPNRGPAFQLWASRFGFGEATGLDVGPESAGLLPTPDWRRRTFTKETDPHNFLIDREWKPGDSIQLAIGQKDLLVTPLQMARFYAMIANGGNLVTPHLVDDVEQPGATPAQTRVLRRFAPPAARATGVDPGALRVVRDGLYAATHSAIGTSTGVFGSFPVPIAGKTGTAEKVVNLPGYPVGHFENQSWWCGYGPADNARLVVCALIENGGHGGTAAGPAALKVFEQYFGKQGRLTFKPSD